MKKYSLIILFLCFLGIINIEKSNTIKDEIKELEADLINNYVDGNNTQVDEILGKIKELDVLIYERDLEIIKYWYYIDDEMVINYDVAPNFLPQTTDHAFVVLGYALNDDGSLKPEAIGRCDVAYASALKYPKAKIYLSGGGTAKENSTATEAGQMKEYLLQKGLDSERIVIEDLSKTTVQNAINTVKLLYQDHIRSVTVITSDYHIRRSNILFKGEILLKANEYLSTPIPVLKNAVYKTGKPTEGKYYEGNALATIMGVKLKLSLLFEHLPTIILNILYALTD